MKQNNHPEDSFYFCTIRYKPSSLRPHQVDLLWQLANWFGIEEMQQMMADEILRRKKMALLAPVNHSPIALKPKPQPWYVWLAAIVTRSISWRGGVVRRG